MPGEAGAGAGTGVESRSEIRVRYAETDQMGVVYHGSYVPWLEVGRVQLLDDVGLPYREIEERGLKLVVVDLNVRYLRPARFDDRLLLTTGVVQARSREVRFAYRLERPADGTLLLTALTTHVALNEQGRPARMPEDVLRLLSGA